jgi:type IV pilus assembly protein PilB
MSEEGRPHLRAVSGAGEAAAHDEELPGNGLTPPKSRSASRFLSDVIVDMGFLSRARVDAAVEEGRASGRTPEQVLLETATLTADQVARAIAERFGLHHVDLTMYQPDLSAVNMVSAQAARRFSAVPIGFDDDGALLVAMADPSNVLALDDIKVITENEIRPVVASPDDIAGLIGRMSRLDDAVAEAVEDDDDEAFAAVTELRESADDAPIIKLVNSVIAQAVEEGASDVHLEREGRDMRVRFRVDGVLSEITTIPARMVAGVISRIKIMGDLDISEKRLPQDGRVGLTVEGHGVDIRIVSMPGVHGEGVVMRLLDQKQALLSLDVLGMSEDAMERFESAFRRAHGATLVTGPTGSGKSTTLYAALNSLNSVDRNIITIEDPVEYQLPGINQIQVNLKAGLTFSRGLRSMLRADPDVIMVGEIRDAETARIAVESALTGHLVLSTLHTNDAPSALTRLTEMDIQPFLTASAVDCVVAQRLARTLCTYCKRRTMIEVSVLEASGFPAAFDLEAYEPVGCGRCKGTGYKGRAGLYEVMSVTDEIRDLTIKRSSSDEIYRVAVTQGMRSLRDDGFERVKQGLTSIAEVARVT